MQKDRKGQTYLQVKTANVLIYWSSLQAPCSIMLSSGTKHENNLNTFFTHTKLNLESLSNLVFMFLVCSR